VKKIVGFKGLPEYGITWSRVHVSRLEKEGKFPKHINLAPQSIGWLEEEILAWIEERAAARSTGSTADPIASAEKRKAELDREFSSDNTDTWTRLGDAAVAVIGGLRHD
jgi:prophage regulatory protein